MRRVILAQVGQGYYVSCFIIVATFVRYPHLNTVNGYTACYVWQSFHRLLVVVAEIVTKEEVAVLIVTIYRHFEVRGLRTTFAANGLALRVLLRHQRLHAQLAELQVRLDTKQRTTTAYQTVIQGH